MPRAPSRNMSWHPLASLPPKARATGLEPPPKRSGPSQSVPEPFDDRTTILHYAYFPELRFGTQTRIVFQDGSSKEVGVVAMSALK